MSAPAIVDRAKVSGFFAWSNPMLLRFGVAIGALVVSSWVNYLAVGAAIRNADHAWLLLVSAGVALALAAVAALSIRSALTGERRLGELHAEVKKAKDFDFARVLVRSFRTIDTGLNKLLHIGHLGLAASGAESLSPADKELVTALTPKSVFLFGPDGKKGSVKFSLSGHEVAAEYSFVSVSILYLTGSALLISPGSIDLVKGDITLGELKRVALEDIDEIFLHSVNIRANRAENETLFTEYERIIKNNPSNEMIVRQHNLCVRTIDGGQMSFPAGNPTYYAGRWRLLASGGAEEERLARAARAITERIEEAKAAVQI